jgi:HPt (histidine-containing phosphotransfer) domain-containing protein
MLSPVYELADGDKDFLNEILESMANNIPQNIKEIKQAILNKDIYTLGRAAHHMKSSIMYSNAEELKELLSQIEVQKTVESIDEIKQLMPRVEMLSQELGEIIDAERKS